MNTIPFPSIIDATARKDLVSCPYKFFIKRVRKLKSKGISLTSTSAAAMLRG